jgi:hypothetical protein
MPRPRRRCSALLSEWMETLYPEEEDFSEVWTVPASYGRASAGRRRKV